MAVIRGSEALMQAFRAEGVEYVFGLPGSTETEFMDSIEDHPKIKYILGLHECIAAAMAVGYARASGKIGIVNLHTFVGLGGAMAPLLDAYRAGVPLLVTAGQGDTSGVIREGSLSADMTTLGKNFAKWSGEVGHGENLGLVVRRAFKSAFQHPTAPVFVSFPQDIMKSNFDFEYTPYSPQSFSNRRPDKDVVTRTVELLLKSNYPILQLGPAVAKDNAVAEVVQLAELIGAPVYVPGMSSDMLFPSSHPLFMSSLNPGSPDARLATERADLTIAIGAQPSAAKNIIQIDNDPWELGKNTPVLAALDGDIRLCLSDLNEALKSKITPSFTKAVDERRKSIGAQHSKMRAAWQAQTEKEKDASPMAASRFAQELAKVLPKEAVIVDESWSYSPTILQHLEFTEPNTYFRHRGVSIGQGLPMALGVKLAKPDRPVVALVGDGSAIWSCQSLWTAAHYNIPVKFIIIHNASYRLVKMNKMRRLGEATRNKTVGLNLETPKIDFCRLAESMNVRAQRAETPEKLASALKSAFASDKPELVEVPVEGKI